MSRADGPGLGVPTLALSGATLDVSGDAAVGGDLDVAGTFTPAGGLDLTGAALAVASVTATGAIAGDDVTAVDDVIAGDDVLAGGDVTATAGNIVATAGNVRAPAGEVFGKNVIADQLLEDTAIVGLRSTGDVAHGMTDFAPTEQFGQLSKASPTTGGLHAQGLAATTAPGVILSGYQGTVNTTKSVAGRGVVEVRGHLKSGTGAGTMGANANILAVSDVTTTRFILDSDGDSHQDVGTAWTNFDSHDDVELLNRLAAHVSRTDDPLRAGLVQFLESNRADLERLKLVTFNDDGHHFVNMSRLTMLHTGAIRQLGGIVAGLRAELAQLGAIVRQLLPAAPA